MKHTVRMRAFALGAIVFGAGLVGNGVSSPVRTASATETLPGMSMAMMGVNLRAVAAGRIERPAIQGLASQSLNAAKARVVGKAALNMAQSALSGNAIAMGMNAAGSGMMMGQIAAAEAATATATAQADAERKATQVVPDEDRPSEAVALLAIAGKGAGASASWSNPETGASGTVSLGKSNKATDQLGCRPGTRTYKRGGTSQRGDFLICREGDDWYDLS